MSYLPVIGYMCVVNLPTMSQQPSQRQEQQQQLRQYCYTLIYPASSITYQPMQQEYVDGSNQYLLYQDFPTNSQNELQTGQLPQQYNYLLMCLPLVIRQRILFRKWQTNRRHPIIRHTIYLVINPRSKIFSHYLVTIRRICNRPHKYPSLNQCSNLNWEAAQCLACQLPLQDGSSLVLDPSLDCK